LDADLYLPAILEGLLGSKKWMASRLGQVGGRSTSVAKKAASKRNGRLGGRPRKRTQKNPNNPGKASLHLESKAEALRGQAQAEKSAGHNTQREFFDILDEFFQRATGETAEKFAAPGDFGTAIHGKRGSLARRASDAYGWGYNALIDFYDRNRTAGFNAAQACGGLKLVLGGTSRFLQSQLDAFRRTALYADTILIPDPVLPWVESARMEEKFRDINLLEAIFYLLRLKPFVNADLSYPALIVFQSWEKSLEASDNVTKEGINSLANSVLSHHLGRAFNGLEEIARYAARHESEFLEDVERKGLFIAPGAESSQPIRTQISEYIQTIKTWRSEAVALQLTNLPPSQLVFNGILERIAPQWHLLENAEELHANPLFALKVHWHYYRLCTTTFDARLLEEHLVKPETIATIRALAEPRFEWLGNVPIDTLVELRRENENEHFRRTLSEFTSALHESNLEDIERTASEVGRGIASLLGEHQREVRKIEAKYKSLHLGTAVKSWTTAAALFLPTLAPFLAPFIPAVTGTAALALAGKYVKDKVDHARDLKQLSRSLIGVLASAHDNGK
jgi:hypothetical protein